MAELKGVKKILTVKWIVKDKKIIKFVEEENDTYKLADNVLNYLDEIKSGVSVNVTIDDKNVTYIAVKEGNTQTPEPTSKTDKPKPEEKQKSEPEKNNASNETEMVTVKAISKTRDYYLFDEKGEKEWFTISPDVKNFLKDVKKGDVLEVKVEVSNDGKRNVNTVVFAKVKNVAEPEKEEKTEPYKKKSSYRDEESTDKRTALMSAKDIVIAYINSKAEIVNGESKAIDLLNRLTKACYENIQSL